MFGSAPNLDGHSSDEQLWLTIVEGYGHLIKEQPADWSLFDRRAYAHAALDDWQACADDFGRAYELNSQFHDLRVVQAGALAMAGNHDAYLEICEELIEQPRAAPTHPTRYRVAMSCLFAETSPLPPDELITLAEEVRQGNPNSGQCRQLLALAHYRMGNVQATLDSADDAIQRTPKWTGHVTTAIVVALTHRKLGNTEEFTKWKSAVEVWMGTIDRPFDYAGFVLHPHDWLQCAIFRRELALPDVE